ncbi:YiiX/YebB-like N1pC/P60 family cysteine hydrolase [Francisellaceae bacterium CB300]
MNAEELKKGDVIFIVDDNEENISSLSYGYGDLSYYHCGIYIGDGKLIEAVPYHGVIEDDVSKYCSKKILVARVDLTVEDIQKVIDTAKNFLGVSYNDLFLPNQENKLYCSELVHQAFFSIANKDFFTSHTLNYFSVVDNKISDFWVQLYAEHGYKVPQGEKGSHPNNLSLDDKFTQLFILL